MLIFVGTSAGEQFPGVWCNCPNCKASRKLGGANIRYNSSLYMEPNILIDLPPLIPEQARKAGVELPEIEHLFITHHHHDHFTPWYLRWRYFPANRQTTPPLLTDFGPLFSEPKTMHLYGNEVVLQAVEEMVGGNFAEHHLVPHLMKPGERFEINQDFQVLPVRANHDLEKGCLNYIFFKEGKTIFYATDTAWPLPETWELISGLKFDVVAVDGTFGLNDNYDVNYPGHLNFLANRRLMEEFQKQGLLKQEAKFVVTHTGPHHAPPYEIAKEQIEEMGMLLAHDGLRLEL